MEPAEPAPPRDGQRRIVSVHVSDGGHGAVNARQVGEIVGGITGANVNAFDLTAKDST